MKKGLLHILLLCVACSLLPGIVRAQATVSAHVFAEVIEAITANEVQQLNFGKFYPETASGGEITVMPQGSRQKLGDVSILGSYSAAEFSVTGTADAVFSISLPKLSDNVVVSNLTNSKTMVVQAWESIPPAGIGTGILTGGQVTVKVGATLIVKSMSDNPVGIYSGTYQISFDYN